MPSAGEVEDEGIPSSAKHGPMKRTPAKKLTHVAEDGRPRMVDVGDKIATRREAIAEVVVRFPR